MDSLAIVRGRVGAPFGALADATVLVQDGRIQHVGPSESVPVPAGTSLLDAGGAWIVPGYVDFHTHGALGADYFAASAEEIARILAWLPSTGVTSLLATTTTAPHESLCAAVMRLAELAEQPPAGARILGLHLEGPWIAAAQRGAQLAEPIRPPTVAEFEQLQAAARGAIRAVSLAPEVPGALELIAHLRRVGVVAAAVHTDATYDDMVRAVDAGLQHVSHCFNGMRGLHHREPGVVGAALALPGLSADVILDGHHVHPGAARALFAARGAESVGLITDSMQATGLGDGTYVRPGNRRVVVRDGVVRLESGALAGSVLTLDRGVRHAAAWFGLDLRAAAGLASGLAARLLGLEQQKGTLAPGADADLCLLNADGSVVGTVVGGRVSYQGGECPEKE